MNLVYLVLTLGILLTAASGMEEPTYDNIMQQADVPVVFMIIAMVITLVIGLIVLGIAYILSDRELSKDSLRDTFDFLRKNPAIFAIGFIMSVILLAVTAGIDMIAPVPPSTYMYGADPMAAMGDFAAMMVFAIISIIITVLISLYFTAVFYCYIKNPKIEDAFSRAVNFYIRLLPLGIITFLIAIFLVILMGIVFFAAALISGLIASISPVAGGILSVIIFIILGIAAFVTFIAIMLRLTFAIPILIYENSGVINSLKESWDRTRGALLSIFVVNGIAGIIYMVLPIIVLVALPQSVVGQYVSSFLMYLLMPISYVALAMLYFNVSGTIGAAVQKQPPANALEEPESVGQSQKPKASRSEIPVHEPPKYVG